LGYDSVADLKLLGHAVCQLRVRDCTPDGRRVPLGQGTVGSQWAAIQAQWNASADDAEQWCVLELPANADRLTWARQEISFLRPSS
jgi:hypothetical protein